MGIGSEKAAHRIAVEWTQDGRLRDGVYIPRRDTESRLNAMVGGHLFPGIRHHARFRVRESDASFIVNVESDDRRVALNIEARLTDRLASSSVFDGIERASQFFASGSIGYSAINDPDRLDGIELACRDWSVAPLTVDHVSSSFFDDRGTFPEGSIEFDCALLMRDIQHEWRACEDLCCATASEPALPAASSLGR